jgi:ABC-type lipoprotein release transport system permease subunit
MKPLSALTYSKNNKKKLITSSISIVIAVSFLFILQTFAKSLGDSMYQLNVKPYETHMMLYNNENNKPISEKILNTLDNNPNVEKTLPFIHYKTSYIIPGSITNVTILGIRPEDTEYVMKKHKITLKEGRLPLENFREVALDSRILKNKKIKLGDKIGNSIDKNDPLDGEYTVVGILDGPNYISFIPYKTAPILANIKETTLIQKSLLIFPKEGKINQVDDLLLSLPKNEVSAMTLSEVTKEFNKISSTMRTLDMVCILAIIVMVISVGSSKYVQFFSRKQEFGVLNALGYTKAKIMKKAFIEVILVNLLGFTLGICFGILNSALLNNGAFKSVGAISIYFSSKAFLIALYIPLFTTLFTLIPVNRMINKLDPIVMIEGN